jgi:hypothetical protein
MEKSQVDSHLFRYPRLFRHRCSHSDNYDGQVTNAKVKTQQTHVNGHLPYQVVCGRHAGSQVYMQQSTLMFDRQREPFQAPSSARGKFCRVSPSP